MKTSIWTLILFTVLAYSTGTLAQKTVLGLPEAFETPKDYYGNSTANKERVKKFLNETQNKSRKKEWIVISDRESNPVYDKPSTGANTTKMLNFKEWFYVLEDKDGWIKLGQPGEYGIKNLKCEEKIATVGWIQKEKMLLWTSGLVDKDNYINRKAFLLNKYTDKTLLRKADLALLQKDIYSGPSGSQKVKDLSIYRFYFVYKREGDRYLLGADSEMFRPGQIESGIIGWVNKRDLELWNTRLCLEPNFESSAVQERRLNENLRLRTYISPDALRGVSSSNPGNQEQVYIGPNGTDVVNYKKDQVARTDPNRHIGSMMRFPYFDKAKVGNTEYYRTGQIGYIPVGKAGSGDFDQKISEHDGGLIKTRLAELEKRNDKVNIFFVIEGTASTLEFQDAIVDGINSMRSTGNILSSKSAISYGALIYRNPDLGDYAVQVESRTSKLKKITEFVDSSEFTNGIGSNAGEYQETNLYYGVKKALENANFSRDEINVLMIIGTNPDITKNKMLASGIDSRYLIEGEDMSSIQSDLASLKVHVHSIQLSNDGSRASKGFRSGTAGKFILEPAKVEYESSRSSSMYKGLQEKESEINLDQPTIATTDYGAELLGSKPGFLYRPESGDKFLSLDLSETIGEIVRTVVESEDNFLKVNKYIHEQNNEVDVTKMSKQLGVSSAQINYAIVQSYLDSYKNSGVDAKELLKTTEQKLDLFSEVFIPVQPEGADHKSYSFVLFMPKKDLLRYKTELKRGMQKVNEAGADYDDKRKALFDLHIGLLGQFTGQQFVENDKKTSDLNRAEIAKMIQGIEDDIEFDTPLNVNIDDIMKNSIVKKDEIDALIENYKSKLTRLEEILRQGGKDFDFVLKTAGNEYYWLKFEEVF